KQALRRQQGITTTSGWLHRMVRSLDSHSGDGVLKQCKDALDRCDEALTYGYDRLPGYDRNRCVVKGDLKSNGRLHIRFVIQSISGFPSCEYCVILKLADRHAEKVGAPGELDVPNGANLHSKRLAAAEVDRPVLVDDREFVKQPCQRLFSFAAGIE